MPIKIQIKRSATAAAAPLPADLDAGELAINTADSKLFHKNGANAIVELGMSPAERTKLSGVAAGATANDTDANLKARANHTGTQAQSTIVNLTTDLAAKAPLASPTFTGTPAAPTAAAATNTTQIATTAFVTTANNLKANLASPALTGTPTAPTAAAATNNTQLATTAFVQTAAAGKADATDVTALTTRVTALETTMDGGTY